MSVLNIICFLLVFTSFPWELRAKTLDELAQGPSANTEEALTTWRKELSESFLKAENDSDKEAAYRRVNSILKACYPTQRPTCLDDLEYYSYYKSHPQEYYIARQRQPEKSDLTINNIDQLPKEIVGTRDDGSKYIVIPGNVEALAKTKGWKTVQYKTKSTGGFNSPPNLFILAIPLGTPPNEWDKSIVLQTSPHRDSDGNQTNPMPKPGNGDFTNAQTTLTAITIDKTKSPSTGWLRIMRGGQTRQLKVNGKDESRMSYGFDNTISWSSCIECHSNPFRAIAPLGTGATHGGEQKATAEHRKQVADINAILGDTSSWGQVTYNGRKWRLGPEMDSQPTGWAPWKEDDDDFIPQTRREDWIKKCAKDRKSKNYWGFGGYTVNLNKNPNATLNYENIAEGMDCYGCHDNDYHGKLHRGFSWSEIEFRVAIHQNMPEGTNLNDDERLAVLACLRQEREIVRDAWYQSGTWLYGKECEDTTIAKKCSASASPPSLTTPAPETPAEGGAAQ